LNAKQFKAVNRLIDLQDGIEPYKSKVHKNKKKYNRQRDKKKLEQRSVL
jgi:hypothetical protein